MSVRSPQVADPGTSLATGLLRSAHPGPAVAVTALTALLASAQGMTLDRGALVVAAVAAGQLSIGWGNDLIDADRDRSSGRTDKPVAAGTVPRTTITAACVVAVVACVVLSIACGLLAGGVHLACVAAGWAYNLGLKATVWSWLPYALAFGGLTVFVALADGSRPPWWWPVGAALLGVGAHLLNVLPDLADDEATGVRGLPHRLGARRIAPVAVAVLLVASAVVLLGGSPSALLAWPVAAMVLALAAVVVLGRGRTPFLAAIAIALIDAIVLVAAR